MSRFLVAAVVLTVLLGLFAGCSRGLPTEKRPLQVIPDMETQKKFKAQGKTEFFEDGRMMRIPPAGTVARGTLRYTPVMATGKTGDSFVSRNPVPVTIQVLERGQERFNIYCSPCHDRSGGGRGIVATKGGLVPPPTFHDDRLRSEPDGHLFDVITNGIRTMPSYAPQIPVEDRWAIVAYIRALQRSQNATLEDVPSNRRGELR